jgi:hypothetical protein
VLIWMCSSGGRVIRLRVDELMGAICPWGVGVAIVVDCWIVLVDMSLEGVAVYRVGSGVVIDWCLTLQVPRRLLDLIVLLLAQNWCI